LNKFPVQPSLPTGIHKGCLGTRLERVSLMCDTCFELDKRIAHYGQMLMSIGDQSTVERIEALIADLQAQKATLHPEQKQ
jgi:hypothetical protein